MKGDKFRATLEKDNFCWFWRCLSCFSMVIWRWFCRFRLLPFGLSDFHITDAIFRASFAHPSWEWTVRSEASDGDNAERPCFWLQTVSSWKCSERYYFHMNSRAQNYATSAKLWIRKQLKACCLPPQTSHSMCFRVHLQTLKGVFATLTKSAYKIHTGSGEGVAVLVFNPRHQHTTTM